ncbi:MAG: hypothetical protein E7514_05855 [Ruminococcaceae bacterium]|nr:hypothetical protein [Oscillospiraceae bacterium]
MFRVSLLPDSYRRHLQSRQKIDIVSKIALVILVCLFIVYGGVAIKSGILKTKLKKINTKNAAIEARFPELEEYRNIYNELLASKKVVDSITPHDTEAVQFLTIIANETPDYVQINEIDLTDWFVSGTLTLDCTVQNYEDMKSYQSLFETDEMKETIKMVERTSVEKTITQDGSSVRFTLVLSLSNAIEVPTSAAQYVVVTDDKGNEVTNAEGEVQTTEVTTEETTAAAEE